MVNEKNNKRESSIAIGFYADARWHFTSCIVLLFTNIVVSWCLESYVFFVFVLKIVVAVCQLSYKANLTIAKITWFVKSTVGLSWQKSFFCSCVILGVKRILVYMQYLCRLVNHFWLARPLLPERKNALYYAGS